MRFLALVTLVLSTTCAAQENSPNWSANPTKEIQAALDKGGRIRLKNVGKPWVVTEPLHVRSDTVLILMPGVELVASPDAFRPPDSSRLLNIVGAQNVEISGAGATIRMQRELYIKWADSQFRHAIRVCNSARVYIHGNKGAPLLVTESGGDGIYIGGGGYPPSRDVTVRHVHCHRNYREGIGVMSVDGCLIEQCRLTDAKGSHPGCGIDIEPNDGEPASPPQQLRLVVVRDCEMSGNAGGGCYVNLSRCNPGLVADVRVERCIMRDNCKFHNVSDLFCDARDRDGDGHYVTGKVSISDCSIAQGKPVEVGPEDFGRWGLCFVAQKDTDLRWTFANNTWQSPNGLEDVLLRVRLPLVQTPNPHGGVVFTNCAVDDGLLGPRAPIKLVPYEAGSSGVYNISGELRYSYRLTLPPSATGSE